MSFASSSSYSRLHGNFIAEVNDTMFCSARAIGRSKGLRNSLSYTRKKNALGPEQNFETTESSSHATKLSYGQSWIPIYGGITSFAGAGNALLTVEDSAECVAFRNELNGRLVARVGYDLFGEVRTLLTAGQPSSNASLPTLELHIAFLRDLITGSGVSLVEIPPVPDGYQFVACLTHDVDHPAIRLHKWDHTMFGFLYRATFESLRKLIRGQMPLQDVCRTGPQRSSYRSFTLA